MVRIRLYCDEISSMGRTRMTMAEIEDLEVRSRWDRIFDDEFVMILMVFRGLMVCDDMK